MGHKKLNRRTFLKRTRRIVSYAGLAGLGYSYAESGWIRVHRATIEISHLPDPFDGMSIALLADIHHGPFISLRHVKRLVGMTNQLNPDLVVLAGDYVYRDASYIAPCFAALSKLQSRLGVFGVLGNHDHWESAPKTKQAMEDNRVIELTNTGRWIEKSESRLRIGGVGDLWEDRQDLNAALENTRDDESAILISHNPDYVEGITDSRVGLVLSGHTHGGQVVLPVVGAPRVPSRYGQKYLNGLVKTDHTQVFVSRGLGAVFPPLRFCYRPEIALLTINKSNSQKD